MSDGQGWCLCAFSTAEVQLKEEKARNKMFSDCLDRALKLWQAKHPDKEFWPDGAENLAWVFDQLTTVENDLTRAKEVMNELALAITHQHARPSKRILIALQKYRAFLEENPPS